MSLRRKLIVIFGSLIVTILMIFSITSYLSSKAAYLAVMKNELGKVVEGMEHLAIYYDTITKTEESILKLKSTIRDIKIGKSGYPYIMNSEGDLILHPTLEGQNLINTKDVNGFEFIKDIIAKKDGETTYYWASKSDPSKIEEKIVSYTYYAPLDWYLVAGITVEEFLVPLDNVRNMLLLLAIIFLTVSIVIVFIVGNSISVPVMKIANEISGVTEQVSAASKEVAEASQRISQVTTEQASNIEETSSSLEEIAGMVNNNVENAERSSEMASEILNSSQKGYDSITKLIESMKEILESNENIQKLSDVIGEIADKLKVIDEIVFQTKLLSFNASVEAERAGEHGRGFAVVAQEVGNLAQMSGKAALEISSIVKDSVKKTEVITSTNKEKVDKGNVLVKHAAEILKEIKEKSQLMQGMAEEIVKASKEQSTGVAQINQAVSELDKSIQDNAANTEETAASGEELTGQAKMMTEIVTNLAMLVKGNSSKESFTKSIQKPSINRTREVKPILSQTRHERVAPASRESDKTISPKVETKRASVESRSTDDEWTKL